MGSILKPLEQSFDGFQYVRRGRRLSKHRVSHFLVLLAVIFLFCLAALGVNMFLHGKMEDNISSNRIIRDVIVDSDDEGRLESSISSDRIGTSLGVHTVDAPPKRGHRRKHLPCDVNLSNSVDYLVEPTTFTNFKRFSLQYIENEDNYPSDPRFAGHQKLDEREKSFIAGNQTLHCGFVKGPEGSPSTGFDLEEKDLEFMRTCKIVVSSCIFGSSDFLRRPTTKRMSEYSKQNVCFVMFVDEPTLSTLSSEGHVPDDRGCVGLWRVVVVSNLPYKDMRRTGKVPKFLSHRLFPSSRYSIWVDSKMRLHTDPMSIIEHFLWRTKSEYAISNHYERHCVWEEVVQNKRLNKYSHAAIDQQFLVYQSDGLIKFNATDSEIPLPSYVPEGSFIVRAHTPMSNLFSCLWFNEVDRFTSRDQLSFAYTYLKLRRMNPDKPFHLNMFMDCERRFLVKLFHHRELTEQRAAVTT